VPLHSCQLKATLWRSVARSVSKCSAASLARNREGINYWYRWSCGIRRTIKLPFSASAPWNSIQWDIGVGHLDAQTLKRTIIYWAPPSCTFVDLVPRSGNGGKQFVFVETHQYGQHDSLDNLLVTYWAGPGASNVSVGFRYQSLIHMGICPKWWPLNRPWSTS